MQNREIIFGAFGQTNIGDELLLLGYLSQFDNDTVYNVISFNRDFSQDFYSKSGFNNKVKFIGVNNLYEIFKNLFFSNKVVFCGGTLLKTLPQTVTKNSYQSIYKVLFTTILSKLLLKKIYSVGIGISPFKDKFSLILSRFSLKLNNKVVFRDKKSFEMYGYKNGFYGKDLVYNLTNQIKLYEEVNSKFDIAINICHNTKNKEYLHKSIEYCTEILTKNNSKKIAFIVMQSGFEQNNDYKIGLELQKQFSNLQVITPKSLKELVSLISQSKSLFVMRFHLGVISQILNKNFMIFDYDPKITYWAKDFNLEKKIIKLT